MADRTTAPSSIIAGATRRPTRKLKRRRINGGELISEPSPTRDPIQSATRPLAASVGRSGLRLATFPRVNAGLKIPLGRKCVASPTRTRRGSTTAAVITTITMAGTWRRPSFVSYAHPHTTFAVLARTRPRELISLLGTPRSRIMDPTTACLILALRPLLTVGPTTRPGRRTASTWSFISQPTRLPMGTLIRTPRPVLPVLVGHSTLPPRATTRALKNAPRRLAKLTARALGSGRPN